MPSSWLAQPDIARIVVLYVIYPRLQLYLAQRQSNRDNEMCDNEMSFSVMPHLSI